MELLIIVLWIHILNIKPLYSGYPFWCHKPLHFDKRFGDVSLFFILANVFYGVTLCIVDTAFSVVSVPGYVL